MKYRHLLLTLCILALMFASSAYAGTVLLEDIGEGNYFLPGSNTITITGTKGQTIINAVNMIPSGGTINLNGNFKLTETINIKKPVTIRSDTGAILDGQGKVRVLRCEGNGFVLEGLTIKGGNYTEGGGINIDKCTIDIINCKIIGNTSLMGGGINIKGNSAVNMTDCEISGNTASKLWIAGGVGAGIYADGGTLTMTNCTVTNNTAQSKGGGLYLSGTTASAIDCNISGNTPDDVQGTLKRYVTVNTSEHDEEYDSDGDSGGGCNAAGLGLVLLAAVLIMRKRLIHA